MGCVEPSCMGGEVSPRTGRTTRMLDNVVRSLQEGDEREVFVVGQSMAHAQRLRDQLRLRLSAPQEQRVRFFSVQLMARPMGRTRAAVFVDHYVYDGLPLDDHMDLIRFKQAACASTMYEDTLLNEYVQLQSRLEALRAECSEG